MLVRLDRTETHLNSDTTAETILHYDYFQDTGQLERTYTGTDLASAQTETAYTYDRLGRLLTVTAVKQDSQPVGDITTYEYDAVGNLDLIIRPDDGSGNHVVTDYGYDELNRLMSIITFVDQNDNLTHDDGVEQKLAEYTYTRRDDGRRTQAIEELWDGTTFINQTFTWDYDNAGRLVSETYDLDNDGSSAGDYISTYSFDLVGNRVERTLDNDADTSIDEATSYLYDANDRLLVEADYNGPIGTGTLVEQTVYDYGNGATQTGGGGDATRQTGKRVYNGDAATGTLTEETRNTYNAQGRLSKVEIDSDGGAAFNPDTTIDYGYDDNGFRVLKDDGATVTHYVADANNHTGFTQVLEEGDAAGNIEKTFLIGHDVLAQHDGTNGLVYILADGHGSTRQVITVAGAIVNANSIAQVFTYTAYGEALGFDPSQAITSLLYTGEWLDVEVGWHYNRARWYDPETGTWNRLDDFPGNTGDPVSLHKYLYVHGDPINGFDPTGEASLTSVGVGISVGAVVSNVGLTVFSGIRNDASVGTIALNVGHNLAIFGLIAGATFVSGPVGLAAVGTLLLTAAKGAYDLYVYWPEMDNVDRSISVAMIATYGAFGIGIRPAAGLPSAVEGASSPIPSSYFGKIAIDMNRAPASSPRNAAGFPRNRTWFWQEVLQERPQWLSDANKARIQGTGGQSVRSPIVDSVWVRHHPEHAAFMGDVLVHHHLAQGQHAVPLPQQVHRTFNKVLHTSD